MHNASCMAGMAFTNAFLGINHSLAHKLGGEFHIPHGRANAVLLPHVLKYNTQRPTKFTIWPKYETFVADKKVAELAAAIGCAGKTTQESVDNFIKEIQKLMKSLDMPTTIRECGIDKKEYMNRIGYLAERAFEDQCTPANPRMPLVSELEELYRKAY